jgi:hypothetical protein
MNHIKPTCVPVLEYHVDLGNLRVYRPVWLVDGVLTTLDKAPTHPLPRQAYLYARRSAQAFARARLAQLFEMSVEPLKPPGQEFEPIPGADDPPKGRKKTYRAPAKPGPLKVEVEASPGPLKVELGKADAVGPFDTQIQTIAVARARVQAEIDVAKAMLPEDVRSDLDWHPGRVLDMHPRYQPILKAILGRR